MGVGDLRIGALATPYTSKVLDLILGARFWAPTGGRWAYLAGPDHSFRLEAVAAAAGEADLFLYGCTLGIAPLWFAGRDGDRLAASCAAGFKVHPVVSLGVEPHVAVFTYAPKGDDQLAPGLGAASFAVQFEPMGTASFHVADFHIGLAGGAGLGGAPGTATARAVLTLTYSAHGERVVEEEGEPDGDLDGIPDTYDACPKEAGPKSRRGCPEKRDADGDGIVEDDACPDAPGARYEDPKANGCPDRDNDHLADPVDPCPEEPGEETGGCPKFARFKGGDFVIDPPISFGANGAELSDDGRKALVEVIATLRANPKIEQVSVAIGSKGANNALTDRRAKALLTLFSDENIEQSRFEVVLDEKLANGKVTVRVLR
jgi:outer membrane protein OmpA-like peptidoglycan-associated protein